MLSIKQQSDKRSNCISDIPRCFPGFCNAAVVREIFNTQGSYLYIFKSPDIKLILANARSYEYPFNKALSQHVLHDIEPVSLVYIAKVPAVAYPARISLMPSFQALIKVRKNSVYNIEIIILSHSTSISGITGGTTWQK